MSDYEVTYTENDWLNIVTEHDPEFYRDPEVYNFSNNRKFLCTDRTDSGVYDGA